MELLSRRLARSKRGALYISLAVFVPGATVAANASGNPVPDRLARDSTLELEVAGVAGIPSDAGAVILNLQSLDALAAGYVTAWPCGEPRPNSSSLVFSAEASGEVNQAVVQVGEDGAVCLYSSAPTELIIDAVGWFPGASNLESATPNRLIDIRNDHGPPTPPTVTPTSPTLPTPRPTRPNPSSGAFVETFSENTGLDRFRTGVFHRDADTQSGGTSGTWRADHNIHNHDCGAPHTNHHIVSKADRSSSIFVCRDHLMTSVGHVDSYSIAWFSPDQTFNRQRTVSWDVNATNLGGRQWWEVAIVPADAPDLSCQLHLPCDVSLYPEDAVVVSVRDRTPRLHPGDGTLAAEALTWHKICDLDPDGCVSKALRRQWSITDNANGTLTVKFYTYTWTEEGSFPDGPFKVVFKDHSYTPNKDSIPQGYTWHWDNIAIR